MSSITKFFKGSLLLSIASIVVRLSGLLVLIPLARLLGAEQLGIYSLVFWIVQCLTAVGRIGVDVAMHRNGAHLYHTDTVAAGRLLGTGSLLMGISFTTLSASVWIWRLPLAEHWLANKDAARWFGYAATMIFIEGMGLIAMTGLLSIHKFRGNSFATSVGAIGRLLMSPVLAWQYGLQGALLGLILGSLLQFVTALHSFWHGLKKHNIQLHCQGFWQESQQILKFGIPFWAGNALISLVTLPIMGELGRITGVEALGQLRIAQSLSQIVNFLPGAIAPVAISILSETYTGETNNQDFLRLRSLHLRGNWLITLTLVLFLSLASHPLISLLFGNTYQTAVPLVISMSWLSLLTVVVENLNLYTLSVGNTLSIAIGSVIQKVSLIGFSLLLIPKWGVMGYVFSFIIGGFLQLIVMLSGIWQGLEKILQKQFLILVACSGVCLAIPYISILFDWPISKNLFLAGITTIIMQILIFNFIINIGEKQYLIQTLKKKFKQILNPSHSQRN